MSSSSDDTDKPDITIEVDNGKRISIDLDWPEYLIIGTIIIIVAAITGVSF